MRRFAIILAVCLGLLLLVNVIAGIMSPDEWAIDAALAKCQEQGWQNLDLGSARSKVSGGLLGKTATIEFGSRDKNQPKTIRVRLRKPVNFLGWLVVDYQEIPDTKTDDKKAKVTVAVTNVEWLRNDNYTLIICRLVVDNDTGEELKIKSRFFSPLDGFSLVIQDEKGKLLKTQGYCFHQSPMAKQREYSLAMGQTKHELRFPVQSLPPELSAFKLQLTGTFPGST